MSMYITTVGMFISLGLVGVIPFIHYVLSEEGGWDMVFPLQWLVLMAAIYIVGALIYGARIPERFWPGNFDIMVSLNHKCGGGSCVSMIQTASQLGVHFCF